MWTSSHNSCHVSTAHRRRSRRYMKAHSRCPLARLSEPCSFCYRSWRTNSLSAIRPDWCARWWGGACVWWGGWLSGCHRRTSWTSWSARGGRVPTSPRQSSSTRVLVPWCEKHSHVCRGGESSIYDWGQLRWGYIGSSRIQLHLG